MHTRSGPDHMQASMKWHDVQGMLAGHLAFCNAASSPEEAAILTVRAQHLAGCCLRTLHFNRWAPAGIKGRDIYKQGVVGPLHT